MTGRALWKHPLLWLAVMMAAFFGFSFYASVAAYDNFHTHNASDVGIVTQALASATFRQHAPFYDSFDCVIKDRCSFLLVHPGLVLYAAVPLYALAPNAITLFALQAFFVAAAALPLYWLTRQVSRSTGFALFSAGLYLAWAPLFAEVSFSLHLECLLPLELIGVAALWQAGRYRWGLLAALVSFLTFEIAPVFVFLIGLFFLVPFLRDARRTPQDPPSIEPPSPSSSTPTSNRWRDAARRALGRLEVRYTLALMALAALATFVLYSFMNVWGYAILGVAAPSVPPGAAGVFYNSSTTSIQSFSSILSSGQTEVTIAYWLILLALAGFLPLLAPRTFVITGPWIVYTFLTDNPKFSSIGLHTTLVAIGPLFIGVAYGLGRLSAWWPVSSARVEESIPKDGGGLPRQSPSRWPARARGMRIAVAAGLTAVVAANLLFLPINPVLSDLGYKPPEPFIPGYFNNPLAIQPGLEWAEQLVSEIPQNATIAADPTIFPLVANHPYAIEMENGMWPFGDAAALTQLPFNLSKGPQYILTSADSLKSINGTLALELSNASMYGLAGYVSSTAIGPLLLFEQHCCSIAKAFGPSLPELTGTYAPGTGLTAGPEGRVQLNASALDGKEIRSIPKANATGEVWTGPSVLLPAGRYALHLEVSASGSLLKGDPRLPVLQLVEAGYGLVPLNQTFNASSFAPGAWSPISFPFNSTNPVPLFELGGYSLNVKVEVAVASISIVAS